MFGTKHNEVVGFESRWKVTKVSSESSTQTQESKVVEKGTSCAIQTDAEVQVEEPKPRHETAECDEEKLAEWLKQIYPKLKLELNEASNSQAFKGYKSFEEKQEPYCKFIQGLQVEEKDKNLDVTQLSWNSAGKALAVSCNFVHENWCDHNSYVKVYILTRDEKIAEKPKLVLTTDGCVTSLQFHLKDPSLLAASTRTGAVMIWNIQTEEENLVHKITAHEQYISQMSWITDIDLAKSILLATCGGDFLKLWNFNLTTHHLTLKARYQMKPPLFSGLNENSTPVTKVTRSVLCFDFSKHHPDIFVVGLEGGLVLQCSVLGTNTLKGHTEQEPLYDPVFKYYEPHFGEVLNVKFSPNRSEMFMTNGSDMELRVYIIGQEEPAKVICLTEVLNNPQFIVHEEELIAGCGLEGFIEIFQLIPGIPLSNITKEKIRKKASCTFAVNPWRFNKVAVGRNEGELHFWNIPWRSLTKNGTSS